MATEEGDVMIVALVCGVRFESGCAVSDAVLGYGDDAQDGSGATAVADRAHPSAAGPLRRVGVEHDAVWVVQRLLGLLNGDRVLAHFVLRKVVIPVHPYSHDTPNRNTT